MESPISGQILEAAATLLVGVVLGMIYDVLRVIRTRSGALAVSLLCDLLFCVIAGAALFLIGMGPGRGELRLYMPAAALAGGMLYLWFFGVYVRRFVSLAIDALRRAVRVLLFPLRKIRDAVKKIWEISKNIFSRIKKWVTMIKSKVSGLYAQRFRAGKAHAEDYDEVQEIRYSYQDSNSGAHRVRCYQPRDDEGEDIPGPGGPAAASKAGRRSA